MHKIAIGLLLVVVATAWPEGGAESSSQGVPLTLAPGIHRFACWRLPDSFDEALKKATATGDPVRTCDILPNVPGNVMQLLPDGTGSLMRGYRFMRDLSNSFDRTANAELRWAIEDGWLHIAYAPKDGVVRRTAWKLLAHGYDGSVLKMQRHRSSVWRAFVSVGAPKHFELLTWRKCMQANKGQGFNVKACPQPMADLGGATTTRRQQPNVNLRFRINL